MSARLSILLLIALLLPSLALAAGTLRVLAWPGYADPDVVRTFEQRTGARVEVSFIDTDDALWQKVAEARSVEFDVFAVNTAELQRYIALGRVAAINTGALTNLSHLMPRFARLETIPGLVHGGRVYAIPYTYAEMGLIYDRAQIPVAPTSITALWDPRWRGKVLAYNGSTHNFSLATLALGRTKPFQLAASDWVPAVDKLIALRRNVQSFYTQPDESVSLFKKGQAALMFANYGSQQVKLLKDAGVDVGYAIPREGALAWLDCWAVLQGARNPALALAWIDYLLEARPGQVLLERQGLAHVTLTSPYHRADDRLLWLEPVEDAARRGRLWSRVLSGERQARRVVAP
ncbi:MAG: extracellular solute-binding protein [Rhodocyclaceae bacterium]|nr:extracellular solute-binding protein [Rhodocyclaceae bacterium]